ncbi:MotE family protein [Pacificoceanicola onchidii]|uniref:MotE family protein n=1 Tax=Pacificoceanicola onchidii TaxID=2562685 RepID=UPI0010A5B883|nr:hypothetical protein [Pacificoceanicola onchidii]
MKTSQNAKAASERKKQPKRGRKNMRGALAAVGGLLIASAVIRTVIGAGEAFAREGGDVAERLIPTQSAALEHKTADEHAAMSGVKPGQQDMEAGVRRIADDDLMPLINALNERENRVKQREEDIAIRMQALSLAEQEIERKLVALEDAEQKLRSTLALAQTAAEDDLTRLTDVYANMKPKQAAALFEEMDPDFAAGFLGRMRPDAAAGIMAGLTPGTAYTISVVLAGRNANVPKQ